MRVAIIGTGYVGLVTGVCLADFGHHVTCIDTDAEKIASLKAGKAPFYEPGLEALIARNVSAQRLSFTTDVESGSADANIVFIAVGTPASDVDGMPDMTALKAAVARCARTVADGTTLVIKSTVPVGTSRGIAQQMKTFRPGARIALASNPEFLRQGSAVKDFMQPDRIVVGVDCETAAQALEALYTPLTQAGVPLLITTFESSELIKYAANTMLAAKVAFINEMADICEQVGANVLEVARGVGLDTRIGDKFLRAGPGFGGSCFPKDTLALKGIAEAAGVPSSLVSAVVTSNVLRKERMAQKVADVCGGLEGKTLAVLGVTFKPETDDMRESPSLVILPALQQLGARVRAYDPQGMKNARAHFNDDVVWCADAYDAARGADACVILTEWNEFKQLDMARLKSALKAPLMIDLRNLYRRRAMAEAGFRYVSVGRAEVSPDAPDVKDLAPRKKV